VFFDLYLRVHKHASQNGNPETRIILRKTGKVRGKGGHAGTIGTNLEGKYQCQEALSDDSQHRDLFTVDDDLLLQQDTSKQ